VLGICYGMQSMAQALGGVVTNNGTGEFGRTDIRVHSREGLFRDLPAETCWMSHRDAVTTAPEGFTVTAETAGAPIAAIEDRAGRRFGVQFHPEVVHTPFGTDLLKSFLFDACDLAPTWTAANVIDDQVKRIREQVGDQKAQALSEAFTAGRLERDRLAGWLAVIVPPILLERSLQSLARTDLRAALAYEARVRAFHAELRQFYYPRLFRNERFDPAQFEAMPRFTAGAATD
jgi:hypothetical protein